MRLGPTVQSRLRSLVTVTGAGLALLAASLTLAPSAAAEVADPRPPVEAPGVVEGFAPYLPQVSCDPTVKPGTASLRATMLAAYGGRDLGVTRGCDIGARSEHKEGRAWDWGLDASVPAEKAMADRFLAWLLAPGPNGMAAYNARRLGVMYVIYDGRIWSSYRAGDGWRTYDGGESHGGHLHISMAWNGAMARTSWWTGKAAPIDYGPCVTVEGQPAPAWSRPRAEQCPAPASAMDLNGSPLLAREATGPYVVQLQRLLEVTPVTGFFGPLTEGAVKRVQQAAGLAVTGTTTPATWAAVRAGGAAPPPVPVAPAPPSSQPVTSGRALPARMSYVVRAGDNLSAIAARWRSTVPAIRSASGIRGDVIRVGQVVAVPVRSGITKFTWTTLRKGDRGVAVTALQTALGLPKKYRTGLFGDITRSKVNALKTRHGWKPDGVAGPGIWRALGA